MKLEKRHQRRKGAVAPLTAILSVVLLGMVAFAIDIAWVVLTNDHLQNAVDSAALAGADSLMDGYVAFHLVHSSSSKTTAVNASLKSARDLAIQYAGYNYGGDTASLKLRDEDIEFGFRDAANKYSALGTYKSLITDGKIAPILTTAYPNTIKVTVRRDQQKNGSLGLFFAQVIGTEKVDLTATASATIYGGKVTDVSGVGPAGLLPMTYDVNDWYHFLQTGQDPKGTIKYYDGNGLAHLQVYPSVKDTGNFGQLSLDGYHAGTSEIVDWIENGPVQADIDSLKTLDLIPAKDNGSDWIGNPGFKANSVMEVNMRLGTTFALPLFKPANNGNKGSYEAAVGNGSDYFYNIVEFVGTRITSKYRDNKKIMVQPAPYVDPFAQFESVAPAGANNTIITVFTTPRLSQ